MNQGGTIRTCIVVSKYPPRFGGMGIQLQRTIPYLRRHGIDATILTSKHPDHPADGIGEHQEPIRRVLSFGGNPWTRARRIVQFRRHFMKYGNQTDVVHTVLLNWEFLLNAAYLKSKGLPVIAESVLLDGDDPLTLQHERLGSWKFDMARYVDTWVGIAGVFRARAIAAGIPEQRFRLIYPGVDLERYRPLSTEDRKQIRLKLDLPVEGRIVVSVGSLIHRKGMDRAIKAWARVRPQQGRDILLLIGPSSEAEGLSAPDSRFASSLRMLARSSLADGTVRFTGRTDAVHEYMKAADLFLFLSRREGLGIVTQEAMASGLPCILSPLDGIAAELVEEGVTGFIVDDPEDPDGAGRLISRVLADDELRGRLGGQGRRSAAQRFSFETRAAALADLYREVLERHRRQRLPLPAVGS